MIGRLVLALAMLAFVPLPALAADVLETIVAEGASDNHIDIIIVAEGYTAAEADKFRQESTDLVAAIGTFSPWSEYAGGINWHRVVTESAESGSDHPAQGLAVDTYFDSTFDCFGTPRLICADSAMVAQVTLGLAPFTDHIILLVNDDTYGGSGGSVVMMSTNVQSPDIAVHELGHSVSGLADTYEAPYPNYPPGDPEPNVDFDSIFTNLKWNHWTEATTPLPTSIASATGDLTPIGAYEGARYLSDGIYRPTPSCMMRSLGTLFCPICEEASIISFYSVFSPVDSVVPANGTLVAVDRSVGAEFRVNALPVATMAIDWTLDGAPIATGAVLDFRPDNTTSDGVHQLSAHITDTTAAVRLDSSSLLVEDYTWSVDISGEAPVFADAGATGTPGGEDDGSEPGGCGCQQSPGAASWLVALGLLLLIRRRRGLSF